MYIHVSSEEQLDGWSLDAQREQCKALAEGRGWTIADHHIFVEPGRSAKTDIRPSFQRMMRHAEMKHFDIIVVHKLDRFSRSLADVVKNVAMLKLAGVGLVSVSEPWLDTATPQGEFMLHLFALLAQWDNQNRARKTVKGKKVRAEAGYWNGTLNFGYTTLKRLKTELWTLNQDFEAGKIDESKYVTRSNAIENYIERFPHKTEGDAIPHMKNQHGVPLAFQAYALGTLSDHDVAQILNQEGYRTSGQFGEQPFENETVRFMLQSRFYLGEVAYRGTWHPGRQEALISQRLFDMCQEARARRRARTSRRKPTDRIYPLSRLALCARCERPLRGQPNVNNLRDYREPRRTVSTCPRKLIPAQAAEETVLRLLAGIRLPEDWRQRVLELSRINVQEGESAETKRKRLENQLDRLKNLYRLGDIEETEYVHERARLRGQIEALHPVVEPELEQAAAALENLEELYHHLSDRELEKLFHSLLTSVYLDHTVPGYVVAIEPKPFLKLLIDISTLPTKTSPNDDDPDVNDGGSPVFDTDTPTPRAVDNQNVAHQGNTHIMKDDAGVAKLVAVFQGSPVIPAQATYFNQ